MCSGHEKGADLGPLITKDAKKRVCELVQSGVDEGASLLLDGRDIQVLGYEKGNFVGTIIYKFTVVRLARVYSIRLARNCFSHYYTVVQLERICAELTELAGLLCVQARPS